MVLRLQEYTIQGIVSSKDILEDLVHIWRWRSLTQIALDVMRL